MATNLFGTTPGYTVKRGDTLGTLARQMGVSVDELAKINAIDNPDLITEGQRLILPPPSVLSPEFFSKYASPLAGLYEGVHRVRRGDTLSALAERYGTTVSDLMSINRITDPALIKEGQLVFVRGGGAAPVPVSTGPPGAVEAQRPAPPEPVSAGPLTGMEVRGPVPPSVASLPEVPSPRGALFMPPADVAAPGEMPLQEMPSMEGVSGRGPSLLPTSYRPIPLFTPSAGRPSIGQPVERPRAQMPSALPMEAPQPESAPPESAPPESAPPVSTRVTTPEMSFREQSAALKRHYGEGVKPYFREYLDRVPGLKEWIKTAAGQYGLSPELLASSFLEEGGDKMIHQKKGITGRSIDTMAVGLDYVIEELPQLIRKGLLSPEVQKKIDTISMVRNESGDQMRSGYVDMPTAVQLFGAMLANRRDIVRADARKMGVELSPRFEEFFSNVYFNMPPVKARQMLKSYADKGYLSNDEYTVRRPNAYWQEPFANTSRRIKNRDMLKGEGDFQ